MNTLFKYFLKIFPPHFETTSSLEPPKLIDYEVSDDWKDNVNVTGKKEFSFLEILDWIRLTLSKEHKYFKLENCSLLLFYPLNIS